MDTHNDECMQPIEFATKLTPFFQNQLLLYFARLKPEEKLEAMQIQREQFFILKNGKKGELNNAELTLASLLLSINNYFKNLDETKKRSIIFRSRKAIRSQKREKLVGLWAVIRKLKLDEGYSLRSDRKSVV